MMKYAIIRLISKLGHAPIKQLDAAPVAVFG